MKVKEIRGQVRQIVKEILPEVLSTEIIALVVKKLEERMSKMESHTKESMEKMDKRHKDVMGYLVRQASKPGDL
jgi:tetrahydromethanopterin S-methyltransferase subunit B